MTKINLPYVTIVELPSALKSYPERSVIKYRPYTYGEIFNESASDYSEEELFHVILAGIETINMDKMDLSLADVLYIGLLRKISSLGDGQFNVSFTCPHCKQDTNDSKSLFDVEYSDLEVSALPISMDIGGTEISFSVLTVGQYLKYLMNQDVGAARILASMCVNMDIDKALELINSAVSTEVLNLNTIDDLLDHDINPTPVKCGKCSKESTVDLTDGQRSIVRPFRGHDESAGTGIRFG